MIHAVEVTNSFGSDQARPVALVTGVGRRVGIGFAVAAKLASDGFDVGWVSWSAYDARMTWGADGETGVAVSARLTESGARSLAVEADLEQPESVPAMYDQVEKELGPISALVMCHAESVDSGILDTSTESFDRHFSVNARATWLLIREFGLRYRMAPGVGRIIAMTSDHTINNLPYGASKGALDRITLAAAHEFAHLGVTANVINPGPTDTGWMPQEIRARVLAETPLHRIGTPEDAANLVSFLCSPQGGWINGQLLHSNGGLSS
jgi:3-oxoacyl-[acyl-carrier protein] reductase